MISILPEQKKDAGPLRYRYISAFRSISTHCDKENFAPALFDAARGGTGPRVRMTVMTGPIPVQLTAQPTISGDLTT